MNEVWDKIRKNYETARECLWCPKNARIWARNEDKGMYNLWKAYYEAKNKSEKDDILYGRILIMMSQENHNLSDYEKYNKFLIPAREANESVLSRGEKGLSEKELEILDFNIESLGYRLKCTDDSEEEWRKAISRIKGLRNDFNFHDGKVTKFEHTLDKALMTIQDGDGGKDVTIEFLRPNEISLLVDPVADWIFDFYCYPLSEDSKYLVFDIGLYKIICEEIRVVEG